MRCLRQKRRDGLCITTEVERRQGRNESDGPSVRSHPKEAEGIAANVIAN